tara:strand:+ start:959 stop:1381 length:423 start_codon:yes stop_codon:yes gene_type:complete
MSEAPNGKAKPENGPEIVLRDNSLRAAIWKVDGEYGPIFNTKISRYYKNDDGEIRETSSLRERDLLPAAELAAEAHRSIRDRKRDNTQTRAERETQGTESNHDWHDDEKSRADIKRERFKEERTPSRGTRREKPRDRAAR